MSEPDQPEKAGAAAIVARTIEVRITRVEDSVGYAAGGPVGTEPPRTLITHGLFNQREQTPMERGIPVSIT